MKKIILFVIIFCLIIGIVYAVGGPTFPDYGGDGDAPEEYFDICYEGICIGVIYCSMYGCEIIDNPSLCVGYCGMTEEECASYCKEDLGMIFPSMCPEGGIDLPERSEIEDFCRGYGFIRDGDCPECTEEDCRGIGFITPIDCSDHGYVDEDACTEFCETGDFIDADDFCIDEGFIYRADCPVGSECLDCDALGFIHPSDLSEECENRGFVKKTIFGGKTEEVKEKMPSWWWIIIIILIWWYYNSSKKEGEKK